MMCKVKNAGMRRAGGGREQSQYRQLLEVLSKWEGERRWCLGIKRQSVFELLCFVFCDLGIF